MSSNVKRWSEFQKSYFNGVRYRHADDPVVAAYADPKMNFIRSRVPISGRILDLGCGNGIFTQRLAREGASVTGLDFSSQLLRENPHDVLACADASALPFEDGTFDVVFEANVLHHVTDRDHVVSEMCRVSRRYIVLLEPNRYNPVMFLFSIVNPAERGGLKSCVKQLSRELTRAGTHVTGILTTGMISQNNTPRMLVPLLRRFDRPIWWGEYIVMIAEKTPPSGAFMPENVRCEDGHIVSTLQ